MLFNTKIIHFIVFLTIFSVVSYTTNADDSFKVFQMYPRTIDQQYALERLLQNSTFDFWIKRSRIKENWTVMVPPVVLQDFINYVDTYNILYKEIVTNVEKIVFSDKVVPDSINQGQISFDQYHNLNTINEYLAHLTKNHSYVTHVIFGESLNNQPILGVKISSGNWTKPGILICSGISGREWIGPASALYTLEMLVNNPEYQYMYQNVDWYIIPVLNPDGYEYTHTTNRMWRKNLSPQNNCIGVDITRNFDFHWGESGSKTNDECEQEYIGQSPFSERESQALDRFMTILGQNVKLYLSLHAFGPMLLYPWTYTQKDVDNAEELKLLGDDVSTLIFQRTGTRYRVDPYASAMYPSGGVDTDWMMATKKVPLVYSLHMPEKGNSIFDPVETKIEEVANEAFIGMQVFQRYVEGKWSTNTLSNNLAAKL